MKARIERDFASSTLRIWLWESRPDGALIHRLVGKDEWITELVSQGERLDEPSIVLHEDAIEAIVREAINVLPVTDATTKHLDDAISVRDRLLSLVEKRR